MIVYLSVCVLLLAFILVFFWASKKFHFSIGGVDSVMLANRSIGLYIGTLSLTASWVGGMFLGTAEGLNLPGGLIWCQSLIGYAMSDIVAGIFFVHKMRGFGYRTMLDPFLWKYGEIMHCLIYIPILFSEVLWCAVCLHSLGNSFKIILGLNPSFALALCVLFSTIATSVGGMYFVTYSNVVFLVVIVTCLWFCVPFVLTNDQVKSITVKTDWLGNIEVKDVPTFIDTMLLLMFGGIPWQVYWQAIFAARSVSIAKQITFISVIMALFGLLPSVILGAAASNAKWNTTSYKLDSLTQKDSTDALPLVLLLFSPYLVSLVGLAAILAGAMSSNNSSVLATSATFTRNIIGLLYYRMFKVKLSQPAQISIIRFLIIAISSLAWLMVLYMKSTSELLVFCSDLVYVIVFPQLLCCVHVRMSNAYGSIVSFFVGLILRILGGVPFLSIPSYIKYPGYDEVNNVQMFPFKTFTMLMALASLLGVSYLANFLFNRNYLDRSFDIYGCFQVGPTEGMVKIVAIAVANTEFLANVLESESATPLETDSEVMKLAMSSEKPSIISAKKSEKPSTPLSKISSNIIKLDSTPV